MSNYEINENTPNRTHTQSNIAFNLNTRHPYTCTGVTNPLMADTQKMSNMHPSMQQNQGMYYNQPYFPPQNFFMQPQIVQFHNSPMVHNNSYQHMSTTPQFSQTMNPYNQNPNNNVCQPTMERINNGQQQYILFQQPTQIQAQQMPQHQNHMPQVNMTHHIPHIQPQGSQQQQMPQHIAPQQQIQQHHQQQQHLQHQQQLQQQIQQMQSSSLQHVPTQQPQYSTMPHMSMQQHLQQKPMQPHVRPQPITYSMQPQTYRIAPATLIQPEKHTKTSSALEIINPETNESIDLMSFKYKGKEAPKSPNSQSNKIIEFAQNDKEIPVDLTIDAAKDECDSIAETNIEPENCKSEIILSNDDILSDDLDEISELPEPIVEITIKEIENIENCTAESKNCGKDVVETIDEHTQNDIISNNGDLDQRFIYSREELIKIGKSALSRLKPKGLPFKDKFTDPIILDHPMNISYLNNFESIQGMNQKPSKIKKSKDENLLYELHSISRNQQGHQNVWRHNVSKNCGAPRYIDLGVTELPLMRSEDGYVTFKQRLASGEELNQTEELVRQIKGILNRIVPQNFDQCLSDLVSLKVGTHEGMTCLVNELFLKAVKEEAYSVTFAKICSYLASIKADVSENEIVTFRSVLLQKCQAMFTTPLEEQLEEVRQNWLEKAAIEKPKTKALMESDVEEQVKKAKDRYYGNIRFIGELYLKGVLITKIICFCIENLMGKENDSDSLICLCKLLETCGSKLETELKGKEKLNDACKTLRDFTESQNVETRVRFRILDILEMRDKKWSLRKVQQEQKVEPKTLEEIKLEKEMEDEKDYYHSLNRRNPHLWNADRRQSLPSVNKNRSSITPKQLSVNSSEPTTLGPINKNWYHGSGYKPKCDNNDIDKRSTRQKPKLGLNGSDISQIAENYEMSLTQPCEADVEVYLHDHLPLPSCQSPTNSSQNSSRSSSHSRSMPPALSKEKLPDSKLAQAISVELKIYNPDQLLKEHMTNNFFCEHSWNSYTDKVIVVYKWLDMHFDTNSDKRRSLSNLLSIIINQGVLDKEDLLKAFAKLLDLLEDLLIDLGNALWDSFTDYLIPFIESMDMSSIDIVENIFNTEVFHNFCSENASIIYSLPWSMINMILKYPDTRINHNIFKLAINYETKDDLSGCNRRLLDIIEMNISKAISIKYQITFSDYEIWFNTRIKEAIDVSARRYFIIINWRALLYKITQETSLDDKLNMSFKMLSSVCSESDVRQALVSLSHSHCLTVQDVLCKLWYLVKSGVYNHDTIIQWQSQSTSDTVTLSLPPNFTHALALLRTKSAFIIQSSDNFRSFSCNSSVSDIDKCATSSNSY